MNKLTMAGIAGYIAVAPMVVYYVAWQSGIDFSKEYYALDVALFSIGALVNVLYWYGLSILGTRYRNALLHSMALVALGLSILADLSNLVFTYAIQYAASSMWDVYSAIIGVVFGGSYILVGFAMQKLRPQFGDITLLYAVFAILVGATALAGNFGFWSGGMLDMVLDGLLYILGGTILLRAAKK